MPRGRPRKPTAYHKIVGNYRPSRHAEPPHNGAESAPKGDTPPEPSPWELYRDGSGNALFWAFHALPVECQDWCELLERGTDIFRQLRPLSETQAKRQARRKWRELGPALVAFWGEAYARETWAWKRYGSPTA